MYIDDSNFSALRLPLSAVDHGKSLSLWFNVEPWLNQIRICTMICPALGRSTHNTCMRKILEVLPKHHSLIVFLNLYSPKNCDWKASKSIDFHIVCRECHSLISLNEIMSLVVRIVTPSYHVRDLIYWALWIYLPGFSVFAAMSYLWDNVKHVV
jgi:hypothetical protein